jgi:hypothetical protein
MGFGIALAARDVWASGVGLTCWWWCISLPEMMLSDSGFGVIETFILLI